MAINKEADFIMKDGRAIYPPVISDESLKLWYDTKGKKNSDRHKDKMFDMSGNKNHGTLENFDYKNLSGYQEDSELVFNGINDTLKRTVLEGLSEDSFTYQLNNNIIAFDGNTVRWVKDGKMMERKGINLVRNGNFWNGTNGWNPFHANISVANNRSLKVENNGRNSYAQVWGYLDLEPQSKYYFRTKFEVGNRNTNAGLTDWFDGGEKKNEESYEYELVKENTSEEIIRRQLKFSDSSTLGDYYYISDIQLINLTAAFGAGNEPTLEEIQAEPDKWQWLPNPLDLVEAEELKGNILGDMEDIIDDHTRDEQSGIEVFTDKADDSLVRVEVDGKSYQHAGSGKNLFNDYILSDRDNFQLGTYNASPVFQLKPNTTYVISAKEVKPSPDGFQLVLNVMNATNGAPLWGDSDYDSNIIKAVFNRRGVGLSSLSQTFTTPDSGMISFSYFDSRYGQSPEGNWFTDVMIEPQLEEGSTATEYELPAPTPDYPIEIHSLNDFDLVSQKSEGGKIDGIEVGGRNYALGTSNEFKDVSVGNYSGNLSDAKVTSKYEYSLKELNLEAGNKITVRLFVGESEEGFGGHIRVDDDSSKIIFNGSTSPVVNDYAIATITVPENINGLKFYLTRDRSNSNYVVPVKEFKFEKGTKATDWTPAPEDNPYDILENNLYKTNILLSEPLRSVGDVKDRLFRDSDGLWKIERNVGETFFDGSESWSYQASSHHFYRGFSDKKQGRTPVSSDIALSNWHSRHNTYRYELYSFNNKNIGFGLDDVNTVAEFNSLINDIGGVSIYYQLETPTTETLDEELQDKLNSLRSFQDFNYVYTIINDKTDIISENLKPTIHTEFLAKDHFKENQTVNNLLIWNRSLEDEELLNQNKLFHERFNMKSNTVKGEPITQTINLTQGGYVANTLSLEYTIEI